MNTKWATFILLTSIAICNAQSIRISGVVKTSSGSALEGAMVRLGKADLTTTTDKDGKFTLTSQTNVSPQKERTAPNDNRLFVLKGNRFFFNSLKQGIVRIAVYDGSGRRLVSCNKVISDCDHFIDIPGFSDGIYLYQVWINNDRYTFRNVQGMTISSAQGSSPQNSIMPSILTKAAATIDDALLCYKAGYQLQRVKVTKSDTSNVQFTLTPFETGTVSDFEGNTYKTLKIGKLTWTIENLRSTKYNDGSAIPQGNYSFYKNTTDAAAKKKWGALYNGTTALNSKLAPSGWHVSTVADWDTLQNYLIATGHNYDGTLSENKIAKAMAENTGWQEFKEEGAIGNGQEKNNSSGFCGQPGGLKNFDGTFFDQNVIGYWWTSTKKDGTYTYYRILYYTNFDLYPSYRVNTNSCSIRLVKNN
jgi:uncharacterized protein (TIGR02145 family)